VFDSRMRSSRVGFVYLQMKDESPTEEQRLRTKRIRGEENRAGGSQTDMLWDAFRCSFVARGSVALELNFSSWGS
jgi:hypothetical protein